MQLLLVRKLCKYRRLLRRQYRRVPQQVVTSGLQPRCEATLHCECTLANVKVINLNFITTLLFRLLVPALGSFDRSEVTVCVSFYAHMFGFHINDLVVLVVDTVSQSQRVVWRRSGQQGFNWIAFQTTVFNLKPQERVRCSYWNSIEASSHAPATFSFVFFSRSVSGRDAVKTSGATSV